MTVSFLRFVAGISSKDSASAVPYIHYNSNCFFSLTLQFHAVLLCDWEAASMSDKLDYMDVPTQTFMDGKDLRMSLSSWNRVWVPFHLN